MGTVKINQYGSVIISETGVTVEGWNVSFEPTDPDDATPGQYLLEFAIRWGKDKLDMAVQNAMMDLVKKKIKDAKPAIRNREDG